MLLTDDEIKEIFRNEGPSDFELCFARAIEAAILAKLASAELPEPAMKHYQRDFRMQITGETPFYTADQLRQAYAQGAASQLSAEPAAKQFQTVDGGWHPFLDLQHEEHTIADGRWPIRELFTLKEPK